MGEYIRVLGTLRRKASLDSIRAFLADEKFGATCEIENPDADGDWKSLIIKKGDTELAELDFDPIMETGTAKDEIVELSATIDEMEPEGNRLWAKEFLRKVNVVYCFRLLTGAHAGNAYDTIYALHGAIWNIVGGIWQSDMGEISNEDGAVILVDYDEQSSSLAFLKGKLVALSNDGGWNAKELTGRADFKKFKRGTF